MTLEEDSLILLLLGAAVASWLVPLTLERAFQVHALARDIVRCSWERHLTVTVTLTTQLYKSIPVNLMPSVQASHSGGGGGGAEIFLEASVAETRD